MKKRTKKLLAAGIIAALAVAAIPAIVYAASYEESKPMITYIFDENGMYRVSEEEFREKLGLDDKDPAPYTGEAASSSVEKAD